MKKYSQLTIILMILMVVLAACDFTEDTDQNKHNEAIPDTGSDNQDDEPSNVTGNNEEEDGNNMSENDALIWPDEDLQKKDEGDEVARLQETLQAVGYDLDQSGVFDNLTTNAITDIQLQLDTVMALGIYNDETRKVLKDMNENTLRTAVAPGGILSVEEAQPVSGTNQRGTPVLTNPYDQLALINKSHALPADYTPIDLTVPDVRFPFKEDLAKKQMRTVAAKALENLFSAASKDGHKLYAQSGYRSYDTQVYLFNSYADKHGEEAANKFSARPGESEHQSGLTMDITSKSVDFRLVTDFGNTAEGQWVKEHAPEFGFIVRYPKGKEDITKYQYEPWHLRYIGVQAAQLLKENGLTLDEYLGEI